MKAFRCVLASAALAIAGLIGHPGVAGPVDVSLAGGVVATAEDLAGFQVDVAVRTVSRSIDAAELRAERLSNLLSLELSVSGNGTAVVCFDQAAKYPLALRLSVNGREVAVAATVRITSECEFAYIGATAVPRGRIAICVEVESGPLALTTGGAASLAIVFPVVASDTMALDRIPQNPIHRLVEADALVTFAAEVRHSGIAPKPKTPR